jgi:hypothetical protein
MLACKLTTDSHKSKISYVRIFMYLLLIMWDIWYLWFHTSTTYTCSEDVSWIASNGIPAFRRNQVIFCTESLLLWISSMRCHWCKFQAYRSFFFVLASRLGLFFLIEKHKHNSGSYVAKLKPRDKSICAVMFLLHINRHTHLTLHCHANAGKVP